MKKISSPPRFINVQDTHIIENSADYPVISLFTGAGGLDIGLEEAGFRTIACVEYDDDCRETLRYNKPEWKLFESDKFYLNGIQKKRIPGDIRDIEAEELLDFVGINKGDAALVVGGAPCQPFSNIGKRLGENDSKNGDLFLEFVRMVRGINPKAFIFENVAGITQHKHAQVINYMVEKLEGLGYGISHAILNAANYGVPQRRERFFLIGIKNISNPAFPAPTHFKDEDHCYKFIEQVGYISDIKFEKWVSVRNALKRLPKEYKNRSDYALMNISDIVKNRMKMIEQGENFKALPFEMRPNCWKNGKHQGNDTFGRMVADMPSYTIRTAAYNPAKGQYIHPFENRGLSTIEMAILQSFPETWYFRCKGREKVTLVSGGRQIGNAVPPMLAKSLGTAIMKQLVSQDVEFSKMHLPLA